MIKVEIGAKAGNFDFDVNDIDVNEIWDIEAHRPDKVEIDKVKNGVITGSVTVEAKGDDEGASIELEGQFSANAIKKHDYANLLVSVSSLTVYEQGVERYTISGLDLSSADIKSNKALAAYLKGETIQSVGNDRDNEFAGGAGKDIFVGGNGNDVYHVTAKDVVQEGSGKNSGIDTIIGTGKLDLSDYKNVENLTGGKGDDQLTGSSGNNTLTGGAGDDTLDGKGGRDVLIGGAGDDTYFIGEGKVQIKESSGKGSGEDTVAGSGNLSLEDFDNVENLKGGQKADTLTGNSGDNVLDGGRGADRMVGGAGDDTYIVDNAKDSVIETSKKDVDTVQASVSFDLEKFKFIENIVLTGKADIDATGNAGNNTLEGNGGDNVLDGGLGADRMIGGDGDDTYIVDNSKDVVIETSKKGHDTIEASDSFDLGKYKLVEDLTLTGDDDIDATGNAGDNTLEGNSGDNVLDGGRGADRMVGGAGDDTYVVDNAKDMVVETAKKGEDTVQSSISFDLGKFKLIENLILDGDRDINATGNANDNTIEGNDGDNEIEGGRGDDQLTGGDGEDLFIFNRGDGKDVITDFDARGKDHEVIEVDGFGRKFDFEDLDISAVGKKGVEVDFGHGDTIFLEGVRLKDVDASDFQF